MWKQRSHYMAPLTDLINRKKGVVKWTPEATEAFEKVKKMCAKDVTLFYPNFGETFDVHTDASEYQLGGIISQNGRCIAYYSKKLSSTQKKYPTIEQELLEIFTVLKEFRPMLLGQKLIIWMDHKNLTYTNTTHANDRVLQQRLAIEEFDCEF